MTNHLTTERIGYVLVNVLLFTAALFFFSGCTTFERAFRKFGTSVNDTTYTTIVSRIPKDSSVLVLKTDTTRVIERIRQGRATVTIIREPTNTTVIADCDSAAIQKKVPTLIKTTKWGVDPAYKQAAQRWQTVSFVLIGLLIIGVAVYLLTHKYKVVSR